MAASADKQIEPGISTALQALDLPPATDIEITPLEKAGLSEGNALLSVRFPENAELPDSFEIEVDQRKSLFKRNEKDPWVFDGLVYFDFDRFMLEQDARAALLKEVKNPVAPRFEGRAMVGEDRLDRLDPAIVNTAREQSTRFRIPRETIVVPPGEVDPARELLITDLSVVQDPTRTFEVCSGGGNVDGAWTFKTLMTQMANTPRTGVDPADFVEQWLKTWTRSPSINTFTVGARPQIDPKVLNPDSWPRVGGKLDLNRAPFRLLAIVNRVDLRSNPIYGGGSGGEMRFVFGVLDGTRDHRCRAMPFTVIFEYGVPVRGCSAVQDYTQQWGDLGLLRLGTPEFNQALQDITDRITAANAAPAKPNGNAINQIRTNEIALAEPWQLRQFEIPPGENFLKMVSTGQTPHDSYHRFALQPVLADYINRNATALIEDRHVVPEIFDGRPFLTGATLNDRVFDTHVWNPPGVDSEPRHKFSLATCSGCHGGEARDNSDMITDTSFVHIDVRGRGSQSRLSKFLIGEGTLEAPSTFAKPDPAGSGTVRHFGDLLRRQQHMANLLSGSCQATGLLHSFNLARLRGTH